MSIKGVVFHVSPPGVFESRQEGGEFLFSEASHRP
jgi:hypothetical protein